MAVFVLTFLHCDFLSQIPKVWWRLKRHAPGSPVKIHVTIVVSLAMGLLSCGKKDSQQSAPKIQNITPEQMDSYLSQQRIYCEDPEFCPDGMARLFSINFDDNAKSSMCAGFLVAPDLVITNSHCIWVGKIGLEKTCSGLYFAFPTLSGFSHTALCSKILWRDDRTGGSSYYKAGHNDFALIQLDRQVPVSPMSLRSNAMTPGSTVYPVAMDQFNIMDAKVLKLSCKVKKLDNLGVAELENCPVIAGNSGSAVMNENLEVVGIIFASSDKHIRNVSDPIEVRRVSKTSAFAFTVDHFQKILSEHYPTSVD